MTASGGGVARKEAVCPGFLPGGFGWVFGFSLEKGAAWRLARRNSASSAVMPWPSVPPLPVSGAHSGTFRRIRHTAVIEASPRKLRR